MKYREHHAIAIKSHDPHNTRMIINAQIEEEMMKFKEKTAQKGISDSTMQTILAVINTVVNISKLKMTGTEAELVKFL